MRSSAEFGVGSSLGNDIRHQPFVARRVFARDDHRLVDIGVLLENGLDFSQLNAEAANLDLVIDTAKKLDIPVGVDSVPNHRCDTCVHPAGN